MIKSKVSIIKNKDLKTFALNHKKKIEKVGRHCFCNIL